MKSLDFVRLKEGTHDKNRRAENDKHQERLPTVSMILDVRQSSKHENGTENA